MFLMEVVNIQKKGLSVFKLLRNIHQRVASWISNADSAEAIYGHISDWDVSNVTDMNRLFNDYDNFNEDLSSWNVSNVTDMSLMFQNTENFTSDLSNWDGCPM